MSAEQRPPVFASAEIRVRPVPSVGEPAAQISVCGITVTLSLAEGRALCTQLQEAFYRGPTLPGVER